MFWKFQSKVTILSICTCSDDNYADQKVDGDNSNQRSQINPLMESAQNTATAIEYKKGYVMRKCCYDANYKKSQYFFVLSHSRAFANLNRLSFSQLRSENGRGRCSTAL